MVAVVHLPSGCIDAVPPRVDTDLRARARRGPRERPRHPPARPRRGSLHRSPPRRGSASPASMLPAGRHPCRCGQTAHGSDGPVAAWPPSTVGVAIGALCQRTRVPRGGWTVWSCPRASLRRRRCPRRDPSLPARCSSRGSSLRWSPRTPAAPRSISPVAYTSRAAPTRAAQTGLSCSVPLPVRVLRSIPRRDLPRVLLRIGTQEVWPSP